MMKIDFENFVEYHKNPDKKYTIDEMEDIRANEFAMHLMCPTMYVLEEFLLANLDFEKLNNLYFYDKYKFYETLFNRFGIPIEVICIKIDELSDKYKDSNVKIEDIILADFFYLYDDKNISLKEALTICFPKSHEILEKYIKDNYSFKAHTKVKKCKVIFEKNKLLNN